MDTIDYTLPKPGLSDPCPYVPDGATDYERQEVTIAWRRCVSAAHQAAQRLTAAFDGHRLPCTNPSANDVQAMAQLVAARAELAARIDGIEHRLVLQRHHDEAAATRPRPTREEQRAHLDEGSCGCHDSWDQCPCAEGGHPADGSCNCCPLGTGLCGPLPQEPTEGGQS